MYAQPANMEIKLDNSRQANARPVRLATIVQAYLDFVFLVLLDNTPITPRRPDANPVLLDTTALVEPRESHAWLVSTATNFLGKMRASVSHVKLGTIVLLEHQGLPAVRASTVTLLCAPLRANAHYAPAENTETRPRAPPRASARPAGLAIIVWAQRD